MQILAQRIFNNKIKINQRINCPIFRKILN
ncbi:hypothetical protein ACS0PU_010353 [Formica fusca]